MNCKEKKTDVTNGSVGNGDLFSHVQEESIFLESERCWLVLCKKDSFFLCHLSTCLFGREAFLKGPLMILKQGYLHLQVCNK